MFTTITFRRSAVSAARLGLLTVLFTAGITSGFAGNPNLVVNGSFEQGNTGFSTQYNYAPAGGTAALVEGTYNIGTNPDLWAYDFTIINSYGDHTSGTGSMMMFNAATVANTLVWGETASVTPNTNYTFTAWVSSVDSFLPATLAFDLNGGSPIAFNAPSAGGVWQQFSTTVNSGNNTSMAMQIFDTNLQGPGNDFALDDISLTSNAVPEPGTILLLTIGAAGLAVFTWRSNRAGQRMNVPAQALND